MIRKGYIDNPEQLVTLRKVTVSEGRAYRDYPVRPLMQGGETNAG